jgi:hypothetical protein
MLLMSILLLTVPRLCASEWVHDLDHTCLATIDHMPFEGMSLRLFSPQTRLWSIYWANSETVELDVPQLGSFENKIGSFYARDTYEQKEIIVQFRWDASNPSTPVWSQAFSPDDAQTWEWNWYMNFQREDIANER